MATSISKIHDGLVCTSATCYKFSDFALDLQSFCTHSGITSETD